MLPLSLPKGFRAAGVVAGVYKKPRLDCAAFLSDRPCAAAAVFTRNKVQAAPVLFSREQIRSGHARAIIANAGCANACTGARGLKDAWDTGYWASEQLGVPEREVLIASTGVIGQFLPMDKLRRGISALATILKRGSASKSESDSAVRAILTTDTGPKAAERAVQIGGKTVRIWGCAKGAGMIHPDMATMLSFVLTDAKIEPRGLQSILRRCADQSYNALSVDGDTSTNDTVFFLANGASGASVSTSKELARFERKTLEVTQSLAAQIAADGEGATKLVEIHVRGARSVADAKKVAQTLATSPLVKTAIHGEDANWGRILAAAGRSGAQFDPLRVTVYFGDLAVAREGCAAPFSEARAKRILKRKRIPITIDLGSGRHAADYLTCDFSVDYVKINADYRT